VVHTGVPGFEGYLITLMFSFILNIELIYSHEKNNLENSAIGKTIV
jgi:hypothetical protein